MKDCIELKLKIWTATFLEKEHEQNSLKKKKNKIIIYVEKKFDSAIIKPICFKQFKLTLKNSLIKIKTRKKKLTIFIFERVESV